MAIYTCYNFIDFKDVDWSPCTGTKNLSWVCEECLPEVEEEENE